MELEAQAQAMRAVVEVDRMLVNASQTARRIGARAGTKCDDLELDLRKQVDSVLFVRSVDVLVDEREIYCSSLYGVYHKTIDLSAYVDGRLRLQPHSGTSPDSTLLIYRWVEGGRGAVVTIDGRHVRDALQLLGRNGDGLILDVGGKLLGADGLKSNDASIGGDVIFERSATFPFRVWAVMPKGVLLNRMASDYLGLIIAFGVFGILLGIFVKRGLSHVGSRRHEMSRALRLGEFVPFFQPLVNSSDKRWVGAEVLIRWRHPKEGLVQPDSFIPLAESSGLIVPITRGLFHSVTKALSGVDLPNGFRLSFNISARHMQCASIIEDCEALQRRLNQWRVQLVLELTERELLTSDGATREIFDALHGMGIKVAVDDFGTGHSSLTYLRDFEMDALKIDKSFVAKIGGHPLSERVLDSILDLAKNLELTTIAEGVETWPQAEFLRERGVPILQGYLFGRPMPAEEFVRRLGEHRHGTTSEVCAAIFE
ncbi:EAL domain-containing protein [Pandoraea bronchicola]|uniref:cyclic-guanylate-specific phosphodiesterase n=1 Tax=Pandoraea bronchicola TaxID=2508287 RepID=A0A5E5C1U4_9BURK|nr:EAL domain-containing protein [Pandoraea bronchicola]VVE90513.1 Putative cyclic-di-GMP phosphodiesterase AdrB [Pandoraea bronchicola]